MQVRCAPTSQQSSAAAAWAGPDGIRRIDGGTMTGPAAGTVTINIIDAGGLAEGDYTLIDGTGACKVREQGPVRPPLAFRLCWFRGHGSACLVGGPACWAQARLSLVFTPIEITERCA